VVSNALSKVVAYLRKSGTLSSDYAGAHARFIIIMWGFFRW